MEPNDLLAVEGESDTDASLPLRELRRLVDGVCVECRTPYSAREAVFNVALGFKNVPRCTPCLSRRLKREETALRSQLIDYIHRRDCYLKAWREAERMDGVFQEVPAVTKDELVVDDDAPTEVADSWDAGDLGCGELVMALRMRMRALAPGDVLKVSATDPAAPEDLPAWCRLTGHALVAMNHPHYFIRRKGD